MVEIIFLNVAPSVAQPTAPFSLDFELLKLFPTG